MISDPYINALRAKFGYAITVHKAQGGEWEVVFLYLDKSIYSTIYSGGIGKKRHPDGHDKYHRWFYTAVTRAQKYLVANDGPMIEKFAQRHPEKNARYWSSGKRLHNGYPSDFVEGSVRKILNDSEERTDGFIYSEALPADAYFCLDKENPLRGKMYVGCLVRFTVLPPTNHKSAKAIQIQII